MENKPATPPVYAPISGKTLIDLNIDELPMLFSGLIPLTGIWALVGASDTCKSMILRQLAMSVVKGTDFLGWEFKGKHKRVIVVCSEDDEYAISFLLKKQNERMGLSNEELERMSFIFETAELTEILDDMLQKHPVDLIIIDAFGDVFTGRDMNQNSLVRAFLNDYSKLSTQYKCSIAFLHHTGKRTEELAPSKNNSIGSQGFEAKMRLMAELRIDKNKRDIRHFCIVKGNYLSSDMKTASYMLKMDEHLTFINTGERVDFSSLTSNTTATPQSKNPIQFGDTTHTHFLKETFNPISSRFSARKLNQLIQDRFELSDKPARRFIVYYVNKGWIKDTSGNSKNFEYELVLEQRKFT